MYQYIVLSKALLCLSIFYFRLAILLIATIRLFSYEHVFSSFSFLSFLYSSTLALMKSTDSCKSYRCDLPLIWLVYVDFIKSIISFI